MRDPIHIVHVASQLDTGGMERLLVEFARHVDRRRYSLRFVSLGARGDVAAQIEACGWAVDAMEMKMGVRPSVVYRLARMLGNCRADIVHTHNTKPLLYAAPAARLVGVSGVVHTRHGQRHGATARQNTMFRLACGWVDRVVCVSNESARKSVSEGIVADVVRTIHNGVDLSRFGFHGPCESGPVTFVGRLTPEKDVATLLRAAMIVARDRPTFRLVVAGAGPCESGLRVLAGELGLGGIVSFFGKVGDVPGLLARASMFVLPSLTEGVPLTVLEAMSRGLPVVATRVGGTPEVVAQGKTGLLVEPARPEELAAAINAMLDDSGRAGAMGVAGRDRVERMFDVRTMVSRYEAMYSEVIESRRALAA